MAQTLLDAGADLRDQGEVAFVPFLHVRGHNDVLDGVHELLAAEVLEIESSSGGETALMAAAAYNAAPAVLQALIAAGADAQHPDATGTTALMAAAINPNADITQTLLDAGAEVDARDDWGGTALLGAAAFNQNLDVVRLLLHAGPTRMRVTTLVGPR